MKNQSAPWANIRRMIAAKIWPESEPTGQQKQQEPQTPHTIILRSNPTRIKGLAREMRTPHITIGAFYTWMRSHGQILPPIHPAAPIAQPSEQEPSPTTVSNVLAETSWINSAPLPETPLLTILPDWLIAPMPEHTPPAPIREELFDDVRQPSHPLDDGGAPTELHERTIKNRMFNQAITGLLGQECEESA